MSYHKLLLEQLNQHLPDDFKNDPSIKAFVSSINETYSAFEKENKELLKKDHEASKVVKLNETIQKKSLRFLLKNIDQKKSGFYKEQKNNLLYVSEYLSNKYAENKETSSLLLESNELLKSLIANLPSAIYVQDENQEFLFANHLFCDLFSIEILNESTIHLDNIHSNEQSINKFKNPKKFSSRIKDLISKKKPVLKEILETENKRYFERDYIPILKNGESKIHLWIYTDITESVETQKHIVQSEERNRMIMNSSLNAILTFDYVGEIKFWNKEAENIFGWTEEEILDKSLSDTLFPPFYTNLLNEGLIEYMESGNGPMVNKHIEFIGLHKNGTEFPIEMAINPFMQDDKAYFCSFIQDISERKKGEQNLKFQEEKYRNIITNMNLGLIEVDNEGIIQFSNQSFAAISGYEIDEIIGKDPKKLFFIEDDVEETIKIQNDITNINQIQIKNKKGELKWWAKSGVPNYDEKGNIIGSIGVHLDITNQKQLEIDLEKQKNKALESSKAKETFLANMSHEIRTPLNAIVGFLRELNKQDLNAIQKNYIRNSSIASKHLLAIINNILDISKIEADEMSLEKNNFALDISIDNVLQVLKNNAQSKGIELKSNVSNKIFKVYCGDSLRIEQILYNLIGNAIKFTQTGSVTVNCELKSQTKTNQKIKISVIDTGIGIEKKFIKSIFKKFSQEEKEITRKFGGTGLGMSITKKLIDLMNGEIIIESEKDKGTSIDVYLEFEKGDIDSYEKIKIYNDSITLENLSILLVEDNDMNRMIAQNTLQYYKCKVTEAVNGKEAIELLSKKKFDIILMDIQMPIMDGIEATKIIRKKLKIMTPIIALTANALKTEIDNCKNAGMNDYITKPYEEEHLIEVIAKHTMNNPHISEEDISKFENLYDLSSLHTLSRGNNEFFLKMIHIFVDQTTSVIVKIDEALKKEDFIEAGKLIHKIKPSIESIGIISILEQIKFIEKKLNEGKDKLLISSLFEPIKQTLEQVCIQLKTKELNL